MTIFTQNYVTKLFYGVHTVKCDNLQYITLGCWVDPLINQASDGLSIILIGWKIKQWVAGLTLGHSKLFIVIFVKLWKIEEIIDWNTVNIYR